MYGPEGLGSLVEKQGVRAGHGHVETAGGRSWQVAQESAHLINIRGVTFLEAKSQLVPAFQICDFRQRYGIFGGVQ